MEDKPENAPEHCPGTQSDTAGKSSACAGCPNQNICASGEAKLPDPAIEEIKQSMKNVKNKIVVLSGKGGVGKSTFTSQLALALALNNGELKDDEEEEEDEEDITQVGVLDIDLCGPSIPKMFGLEGQQLRQTNLGWSPSYYRDNLGVISIGFMLPNLDDPVIWRGPKKNGLIKQFLRDVYWGDTLDYLVIDTPPGTSDEHLTIVQYLRDAGLTGAVIVTTPQDVACDDVRKEISFCKKVKIPILGIVENMSGFVCPGCKNESVIFPSKGGGGERLAKEFQIPFLGKIPLDPSVMSACENGKSILKTNSQSPASVSLKNIVDQIKQKC